MLPFLIAGASLAAVGFMLDDEREKKIKKKKKKLKKLHTMQTQYYQQQEKHNNHRQQELLFKQIKEEQSMLKQERKALKRALKQLPRDTSGYHQLLLEIRHYDELIEHKQADADIMRF